LLPGVVRHGRAHTVAGEVPLRGDVADGGRPVTVLLRPEQVRLASVGGPGHLTGRVLRHDFHGHDLLTVVRLDDGTELQSRRLNDGPMLDAGIVVQVRIHGAVRAWAG